MAARNKSRGSEGRDKAPLGALRPLIPFAAAYRGRILAAFISLLAASCATLTVPIAMRRVIDHGFSPEGHSVIDAYFMALLGVVAISVITESPLANIVNAPVVVMPCEPGS